MHASYPNNRKVNVMYIVASSTMCTHLQWVSVYEPLESWLNTYGVTIATWGVQLVVVLPVVAWAELVKRYAMNTPEWWAHVLLALSAALQLSDWLVSWTTQWNCGRDVIRQRVSVDVNRHHLLCVGWTALLAHQDISRAIRSDEIIRRNCCWECLLGSEML